MALHPSRRAYGFSDTDEALVRYVDHLARQYRLTFDQREALDAFYFEQVAKRGRQADEALLADFINYAEGRGISFETADEIAAAVLTSVRDGVVPDFPSPSPAEDQATIAKAQELMRSDPWHKDIESERAYYDVLDRQSAAPSKSGPLSEEVNTLGAHATNAKGRAAEIAEIMKTDFPRYFSDKAMQQEFAELKGASAWGTAPNSTGQAAAIERTTGNEIQE
jgi:hypothetical protein